MTLNILATILSPSTEKRECWRENTQHGGIEEDRESKAQLNGREIGGSLTNTKRKDKRELGQRAKCHYLILLSR